MPACHAGDRRFKSGRVRHLLFKINFSLRMKSELLSGGL